ncbi:MAG: hypothetical protein DRO09_03745 [Thermoprotei archaeon]|nr:MAG: hypothetical protein DRO09_03745 [Thermoprotei archaeon]
MKPRILTLDANVFIAALKADEKYSEECADILRKLPGKFVLAEPSIVYQEVCGTLARRVSVDVARRAEKFLDLVLHPKLVFECGRNLCKAAYSLCREYDVYSTDALYLKVALDLGATLVSLDGREFIDRVKRKNPPIEAYHVSEFPY